MRQNIQWDTDLVLFKITGLQLRRNRVPIRNKWAVSQYSSWVYFLPLKTTCSHFDVGWIGGASFYHHLFSCTLANVKSKSVYLDKMRSAASWWAFCLADSTLPAFSPLGIAGLLGKHQVINVPGCFHLFRVNIRDQPVQKILAATPAPEPTLSANSVKTWSV